MSISSPSVLNTGAQPYSVINQPATIIWPITLAELKLWAKVFNSLQDALLQKIINGVTLSAEKYTKLSFITKEYETFRDVFGDVDESPNVGALGIQLPITLRRSPFQSVESIEYISDSVATPLADFQIGKQTYYSKIFPAAGESWPCPDSGVVQPITIKFKAGFGDTGADVPEDLKNALLAHATKVFKNPGDCSDMGKACSCAFAPPESMAVYNQYRIIDFRAF